MFFFGGGGGSGNFVLFGDFRLTGILFVLIYFLSFRGEERERNMKLDEYGSGKNLRGAGEEETSNYCMKCL